MDIRSLIIGLLFMAAAQASAWFQLNSQFFWEWCKKYEWFMIIVPSIPISFFYLYATKYLYVAFDGALWPSRIFSFGTGVIIFAVLVYIFNNEGINVKTIVSLTLACALMAVQVFWK
tara:strand:+ start:105 stop:455 length:351 start_codon:yes stop_codon:yes gene_type:complete